VRSRPFSPPPLVFPFSSSEVNTPDSVLTVASETQTMEASANATKEV